jgi:hypothetical protein
VPFIKLPTFNLHPCFQDSLNPSAILNERGLRILDDELFAPSSSESPPSPQDVIGHREQQLECGRLDNVVDVILLKLDIRR